MIAKIIGTFHVMCNESIQYIIEQEVLKMKDLLQRQDTTIVFETMDVNGVPLMDGVVFDVMTRINNNIVTLDDSNKDELREFCNYIANAEYEIVKPFFSRIGITNGTDYFQTQMGKLINNKGMINHALRNFLNQGSYNKAESDTFVSNIMYSLTENYQEEIQACGMTQEEYNMIEAKIKAEAWKLEELGKEFHNTITRREGNWNLPDSEVVIIVAGFSHKEELERIYSERGYDII